MLHRLIKGRAGIEFARGTSVPTDATVGYAPGCLFIDTDASAGAQLWVNRGTHASCDFELVVMAEDTQTISGTYSGGTFSSPTITGATVSGTVTDSATTTDSGTNTFTGACTFNDLIDANYNPYTRVYARSDFNGTLVKSASLTPFDLISSTIGLANFDWVLSGSGGSASSAYATASADGGCWIRGGSKSSSEFAFIHPSLNGRFNKIQWKSNLEPRFRAVIKPGGITQAQYVVGLYSSMADPGLFGGGASGSHRVEVWLNSSDSMWKIRADMNGSNSSTDSASGISAQAAGTVADIEIRFSAARVPSVYINSTLVWTSARAMTTGMRLIPILGVQTLKNSVAGAALSMGIYHVEMSQNIP